VNPRGLVAEVIEIVVEGVVEGGSGSAGAPEIHVDTSRVTLRTPARRSASGTPLANRVELLWLTPPERALLMRADIDAVDGLGALITPLLLRLGRGDEPGAGAASVADRRRLAVMVRGLLSAIAAERLQIDDERVTRPERLVVLAMQFVHAHLDDPELTSSLVARRLGVSLRTLQDAFRQTSAPVGEWVRLLRLERARIEIDTSPDERPLDVAALGARWGFRGRNHFARAFERRYGVRPETAREVSRVVVRN
jgi:AraC-like DNA-binding protein